MGPFVFETALETEQQQAQPQDRWRPWTRALGFGTLALLGATAVLTVVRRRTAAALKWHARVGWVTLGMAVAYAVVTLLRS